MAIIVVLRAVVTLGVSLSWYGYIPVELPFSPSSGTYSIDGGIPINFKLNGLPVNSTSSVYNQKFFETAQLSATSHTLQVVYQGNNSTPLTLTELIIQNSTLSSTTTSASSLATFAMSASSLTTSVTTSGSTPGRSSSPLAAIVGGVIGGLVLIIFVSLGFFLLYRRLKRAAQEKASLSTPKPFEYTPPHTSSVTPNPSPGGISHSPSQVPQMASAVTKGQVYHGSRPSVTNADVSQSIESPSTHPTNLRANPLQQNALILFSPSSSSPPASTSSSSVPSPLVPLSSKVERKAEALPTLRPQRRANPSVPAPVQSNNTRSSSNADVVLHADSGIRIRPGTTSTMDVPPVYTPD